MSTSRRSSKASPKLDNSTSDAAMSSEADEGMMVDEDNVPGTQPVDDRVLKGVVAYVEVRSNTENRSRSVSKQLELLGAIVVQKFGCDVTHVIWKEGKKSSKDKAMKKGLHLVSVLWVDSCKQNQEHVAESLFPVHDPADGSPLVLAKLKRVKSMQPKSLEEHLQDGGIKKRRRKRKLVAEDFEPLYLQNASPAARARLQNASPARLQNASPAARVRLQNASPAARVHFQNASPAARVYFQNASPVARLKPIVLVAETQQPMSPLVVGPMFTPTPSLIPNTPDSMRRALEGLSKRLGGTPSTPVFTNGDESPTFIPSTPLQNKRIFFTSIASCSNTNSTTINNLGEKSTVASDSSDTEKDDRPAKRQRVSSGQNGQRSSGSKKKGQRSLEKEETSSLLADCENNSIKKGRVAELSKPKPKKGRRSSTRIQNPSVESEEVSTNVINSSEVVLSSRLSELKESLVKAKKGRRSSMRITKQIPIHDEDTQAGAGNSSFESRMENNKAANDADITTSRLSELKKDSVKAKKGRRSSMRITKQIAIHHDEDNQAGASSSSFESRAEEIKAANVADITTITSRLSELKGDCDQIKKRRRSSMRIPNRKSVAQFENNQTEAVTSLSSSSIGIASSLNCNSKQNNSSITSTNAEKSVGSYAKKNSATCLDLETETTTLTVTKKRGKRKLMSLSSQCQPSEELIVPSQVTTKSNRNLLGNDPFMFPNLVEEEKQEEQSNKKRRGRQTSAPSSRKRKMFSSSESENEPPNGSQKSSSSQPMSITLIPTNRNSLEEFKDHQPSITKKKKKTLPASQTKRRKTTSALSELNTLLSDSEPENCKGSMTGRKNKKATSRGRHTSSLGTSTDSDADSSIDSTKSKKSVRIASQSVRKSKKIKPSLVMTSMHATDRELVLSVAKGLKQFKIVDTVCDTTTHVVVGDNRRTLNVLSAIARGCWLLSMEWVLNSVEAGYWLPEEAYEVHDDFPAAKMSRLERLEAGDSYKQDLFAPPGSLYITEDSCPSKERLVEFVELCGGLVADRLIDATLCVGVVKCKTDTPVVSELWVLDCITHHTQLPLEPYFLNG